MWSRGMRARAKISRAFSLACAGVSRFPRSRSAELIYALNQLEEELKGCGHDRPPDGPSPAQAGTRVTGVVDRCVAGRLRRSRDHGHPDGAGSRRADPFRPGHSAIIPLRRPQLRSDDLTAPATWPDRRRGAHSATAAMPWRRFGPQCVEELCQTVREQVADGACDLSAGGTDRARLRRRRRAGQAWPSTRRAISRLIDYPFADMTITVEAGMTLSALRSILAEQHQRVLVDAPHPDRATAGGDLCHQHQRPAPVCGRAAARSDHRRQLRHVRRPWWSRAAGGSSRTSPATIFPSS